MTLTVLYGILALVLFLLAIKTVYSPAPDRKGNSDRFYMVQFGLTLASIIGAVVCLSIAVEKLIG